MLSFVKGLGGFKDRLVPGPDFKYQSRKVVLKVVFCSGSGDGSRAGGSVHEDVSRSNLCLSDSSVMWQKHWPMKANSKPLNPNVWLVLCP